MENLNTQETKQALKACPERKCSECPMTEGRGCAVKLYSQALNTIERLESENMELEHGKQNL